MLFSPSRNSVLIYAKVRLGKKIKSVPCRSFSYEWVNWLSVYIDWRRYVTLSALFVSALFSMFFINEHRKLLIINADRFSYRNFQFIDKNMWCIRVTSKWPQWSFKFIAVQAHRRLIWITHVIFIYMKRVMKRIIDDGMIYISVSQSAQPTGCTYAKRQW